MVSEDTIYGSITISVQKSDIEIAGKPYIRVKLRKGHTRQILEQFLKTFKIKTNFGT